MAYNLKINTHFQIELLKTYTYFTIGNPSCPTHAMNLKVVIDAVNG
jgi:hypothetical protein